MVNKCQLWLVSCMCVLEGFAIGMPIKKNDRSRNDRNGRSVNGTQRMNMSLFKQIFAQACKSPGKEWNYSFEEAPSKAST